MKRLAGWAGAALLGLPVALLVHTAAYGNEHVVGGSDHQFLVGAGWLLAALCGVGVAAAGLLSSRCAQSGSIAAARLTAYLPGWLPLALCAAGWFFLVERCESPQAALRPIILVGIALAALLAARCARALVRAFADLAVAWRAPARTALGLLAPRPFAAAPLVLAHAPVRRRFARPPPLFR